MDNQPPHDATEPVPTAPVHIGERTLALIAARTANGVVLPGPDRRIVRVALTPQGQKARKDIAEALASYYMESLDDISEPEREIINHVMERLRDAMTKGLEVCCDKYCKQQENKG